MAIDPPTDFNASSLASGMATLLPAAPADAASAVRQAQPRAHQKGRRPNVELDMMNSLMMVRD